MTQKFQSGMRLMSGALTRNSSVDEIKEQVIGMMEALKGRSLTNEELISFNVEVESIRRERSQRSDTWNEGDVIF